MPRGEYTNETQRRDWVERSEAFIKTGGKLVDFINENNLKKGTLSLWRRKYLTENDSPFPQIQGNTRSRTWTDEEKTEILASLKEIGRKETLTKYKVPVGTLYAWINKQKGKTRRLYTKRQRTPVTLTMPVSNTREEILKEVAISNRMILERLV